MPDLAAEKFNAQVSESIKLIFDLTSRIDERVKAIIERENNLEIKVDKLLEFQHGMNPRLVVLEDKWNVFAAEKTFNDKTLDEIKNKIQLIEVKLEGIALKAATQDTRLSQIFDWIFKMIFVLISGYLLYKFGWQH